MATSAPPEWSTGSRPRRLGEWLRIFSAGWVAALGLLAAGLVAGAVASVLQERQFAATSVVVVTPARAFLDPELATTLPDLSDTVARIAETPTVLTLTGRRLGTSPESPREVSADSSRLPLDWLRDHLLVRREPGSSVIEMTGFAETQAQANTLTGAAVGALKEVVGGTGQPRPATGIAVRSYALEEEGRVRPNIALNLAVGVVAGLLLGIPAAFALGLRRTTGAS